MASISNLRLTLPLRLAENASPEGTPEEKPGFQLKIGAASTSDKKSISPGRIISLSPTAHPDFEKIEEFFRSGSEEVESKLKAIQGEEIGKGSGGCVYLLKSSDALKLDREYVIKRIEAEESRAVFSEISDYKRAAELQIAPDLMYAYQLGDTGILITQKFQMDGCCFLNSWREKKENLDLLVDFIVQFANLVTKLEKELGKVYTDLKPENVVLNLNEDGSIEKMALIDFGGLGNFRNVTPDYADPAYHGEDEETLGHEELIKLNSWSLMTILMRSLDKDGVFLKEKESLFIKEQIDKRVKEITESFSERSEEIYSIAQEIFSSGRKLRRSPSELAAVLIERVGSPSLKGRHSSSP